MNVSCALTIPDRRCGLALFSAVKNRSRQRKAVVYATLQRVAAWATVPPRSALTPGPASGPGDAVQPTVFRSAG